MKQLLLIIFSIFVVNIANLQSTTLPEYITSNTTLTAGPYEAYTNVTVNSGVTLTINPGAVLRFAADKRLLIKGTLNVNGTVSNRVTFTKLGGEYWYGIKAASYGAKLNITYAHIERAHIGVYDSQSGNGLKLIYTIIEYCGYGVYVRGSYAQFVHNNIHHSIYVGLQAEDYSSIILQENAIYFHGNGCVGLLLAYSSSVGWGSLNHIYLNVLGVHIFECDECHFDNNDISDNDRNLWAIESAIFAPNTWWGDDNKNNFSIVLEDSYINYTPWRTSPIYELYELEMGTNKDKDFMIVDATMPTNSVTDFDTNEELTEVKNLLKTQKYAETQKNCQNIIASTTDVSKACKALDLYYIAGRRQARQLYDNSSNESRSFIEKDVAAYLKRLSEVSVPRKFSKRRNEVISGYAALLYSNYCENKVESLDNIIIKYSEYDKIVQKALYEKIKHCYLEMDNKEMAKSAAATLNKKYPNSNASFLAKRLLSEKTLSDFDKQETAVDIPEAYSLSDAYPNPFNPTTHISLMLLEGSQVKLEVYNINGQKMATLINGYREAGSYEVMFNGANLASGVYFYRVITPKFTAIKRMLLVK